MRYAVARLRTPTLPSLRSVGVSRRRRVRSAGSSRDAPSAATQRRAGMDKYVRAKRQIRSWVPSLVARKGVPLERRRSAPDRALFMRGWS
jgi:hypothetical protein